MSDDEAREAIVYSLYTNLVLDRSPKPLGSKMSQLPPKKPPNMPGLIPVIQHQLVW